MPGYRHTGGGWYELDDGRKVKGKVAAQEAATAGAGAVADGEAVVDHEHRYGRGRTAEGKQVYICYPRPEHSFEGCGHTIPR